MTAQMVKSAGSAGNDQPSGSNDIFDAVRKLLRSRADVAVLLLLLAAMFFLPRGLPLGIAVLGLVTGLTIGLNSLGVILIYRSTRIINFAQIAFGSLTVVWFYLWTSHLQWIVLLHQFCSSCVPWVKPGANLQENPSVLLDALIRQKTAGNGWAGFLLHFNFWLSLGLAVGLATLLALGVGKMVSRFWSKTPRLVPTVAMLALGLATAVGAATATQLREVKFSSILGIWRFRPIRPFKWWPYGETASETAVRDLGASAGERSSGSASIYTPIGDHAITIDGVPFHLVDQAALVVAVLAFVTLLLYFRYARAGVVIRGLSENADRAQTLGIDSDRLVHRTWMLSGLLSGLVGALAVISQGQLALLNSLDLKLLAAVLAIAVFARLSSLPLAMLAAGTLGVISQAMFWNFKTQGAYNGLLVIIVGLALILQTRRATRSEQEASVAWLASPEIRPTPRELRGLPSVSRWIRGGLAIAGIVLIGLPFVADPGQLVVSSTILIQVVLGLSLLILTGWAGQVSLGQVALAAVGAYVTVDLAVVRGIPLPLGVLGGALAGAAAAALVGIPALRLRGPYLIVMTLVFSIGITDTLLNPSILGGRLPVGFKRPLFLGLDLNDERAMYYLCLGVVVLSVALVRGLKQSRTRRALIAARDNEPAAQVFGIDLVKTRIEGFAVSGFLAGIAGALLAIETHGVKSGTFSAQLSVLVFLMIVIGGAGSLAGPLAGGAYFGVFSLLGPAWASFAMGGAGVGLLQFAPGGIGGLVFRMRDSVLRRMAIRNRIPVPSLLADFSRTSRGALRAQIVPKRHKEGATEFVPRVHRLVGPGPGPVEGTWLGPRSTGNGARPQAPTLDEAAPKALLSCQRLDVSYGQAQVLFKVDFEVFGGQILGLIGTNGAGKTTLLRTIAGLHAASGGAIYLDGEDITRVPAHKIGAAGVVTVPGGEGIFPSLSVAENLGVAMWTNPEGADKRRAEILAAFPRLEERLATLAGDLSGGEKQMLALAQAFLVQPRVLLVDELSMGLSPQVVETILDLLRKMRDQGTAIVIVEQSVNLTVTAAERAVVLEKGEVRYAGSARQLLAHPELFATISFGTAVGGVVGGSELARRRRAVEETREIALELSGVRTSYGGVVAVDDVSLDVAAGEIVGVIGPNGAGKTTLFDVISGFQPAERGSVRLLGTEVTGMAPPARAAQGLQRSFQDVRLFPSLTVRDNIAVALETHLQSRSAALSGLRLPVARRAERTAQQRIDMLIELMGLGDHQDKVMAELSTGTRRIIDIACQLAARPKVLLLDEPSSGLAQTETETLGPIIARISKDLDSAILLIEHDIPLVSAVSARLVAMDLGRVIAAGTPENVVNDPLVRQAYFGGASEEVIQRSGQRRMPVREGAIQ